jgi:hypothetical protein
MVVGAQGNALSAGINPVAAKSPWSQIRRFAFLIIVAVSLFVLLIGGSVGTAIFGGGSKPANSGPSDNSAVLKINAEREEQRRQAIKDKADYMRDHGWVGSYDDEVLAKTYDPIQSQDDAKAARDQRLGH